jgi:hypothetical protein
MHQRIAVALLVTIIALSVSSMAQAYECGPHKNLAKSLMKKGYGWLSTSINGDNMVVQTFIRQKTREWAMMVVDSDMDACIVTTGTHWVFAEEGMTAL